MATETPDSEAGKKPNRLGVVAATLLAIVAAGTLAQALVFASHGVPAQFNTGWTPGLLAVLAASWMGAAVKNWASWRRWIWLPVGLAVVLSGVTEVVSLNMEQAAVERAVIEEHERMCADAREQLADLTETHEALLKESNTFLGPQPTDDLQTPRPLSPGQTDWAELTGMGSRTVAWNLYVENGGPEMETARSDLEAVIWADC